MLAADTATAGMLPGLGPQGAALQYRFSPYTFNGG